jgi:hypothetical protein
MLFPVHDPRHDPVWIHALLAVHITAGFGSFFMAPIALVTAKGGRQHKRWGMVYLWCMGIVAATALPLSLYRPILFLAMVAVFSFYAAFSGYRVLKLKALAQDGSARPIDWLAAVVTFCSSAALAWLGWFRPEIMHIARIVPVLFGFLGMRLAYRQMRSFLSKPTEKMFWWYTHLGNMIGSYIAAWTAFSVTTLPLVFGNHLVLWLWPAAVGVPAIALTTGYYQRKFSSRKPLRVA